MLSLRRLLPVSLLVVLLSTCAAASTKKETQEDLEEFQRLLDQADPPSLHSALHDYSPKKFRHGMFEKDRTAAEVLHRDDASLASSIVALARRQDNSTTTASPAPGQSISTTSTPGQSPTTHVTPVPPIATDSVSSSTGGPTTGTATTPAAGSSPNTASTTATSASSLAPGESPSSAAGSPGESSSSVGGSTPVSASGSTTLAPGSSPSPTNGAVVTTTNAQGVTIVSTVGGGYSTLSPGSNQGSSMSSSPQGSQSQLQSHTTTSRRTTTLPNGSQSTVTAVTVVAGNGADTTAPSGTAGVGSGSGTSTTKASPGLQTGVATRMGWGVEALAVVGGAVGVAMMMVSISDHLKHYKPQTPSPRTPRNETRHNNADNIERYLQEDGHRTWGFVIYRCTYESDDDWDQFMERLRYQTRHSLEAYNGLDMMDSLSMTVFEDRSLFDGASTSIVREHFKQWATTAPQQEQGTGPALSQRYRYCVHVDAVALKSVIHDAPAPPVIDTSSKGFVNVIWLDCEPSSPNARGEEIGEPIEGCIVHDVGWMRVAYQDLTVGMCYFLRGYDDWYHEYRRPPIVAHS